MSCLKCGGLVLLEYIQTVDLTWQSIASCRNCGWNSNEATDEAKRAARQASNEHDAKVAAHLKARASRAPSHYRLKARRPTQRGLTTW